MIPIHCFWLKVTIFFKLLEGGGEKKTTTKELKIENLFAFFSFSLCDHERSSGRILLPRVLYQTLGLDIEVVGEGLIKSLLFLANLLSLKI